MCGIFGIVADQTDTIFASKIKYIVDSLFILSESRGKEASGAALIDGKTIHIYKQPIRGSALINDPTYQSLYRSLHWPNVVIGHSRLATNGVHTDNFNNQPVQVGSVITVHNGIIVNDDKIWKKFPQLKRKLVIDTELFSALTDHFLQQTKSIIHSVQKTYRHIEGETSVAILCQSSPHLVLATNTGSIYVSRPPRSNMIVFASEAYIIGQINQRTNLKSDVFHINPGAGMAINTQTLGSC